MTTETSAFHKIGPGGRTNNVVNIGQQDLRTDHIRYFAFIVRTNAGLFIYQLDDNQCEFYTLPKTRHISSIATKNTVKTSFGNQGC